MIKFFNIREKIFIENHPELSAREIGKLIGRTESQIKNFRYRNNIKVGPKGFSKGAEPWNKGKHFVAGGKSLETRFKPGRKLPNERPIGTVFTQNDHGIKRLHIKLPENRQYSYPRYIIEQHIGKKLSTNEVVIHKDGNPLNCQLSNLEVITRAENIRRNENRKKAAQSMRTAWGVHRTMTEFKVRSPYKWKTNKVA